MLHIEEPNFTDRSQFRTNLKRMGEFRYSFELCARMDQLIQVAEVVCAHPEINFVLDHAGNPSFAEADFPTWSSALRKFGACDNAWCKLSGLVSHLQPDEISSARLRPYFETMFKVFGSSRVVWGSDWPVCTILSSLAEWVTITRELLDGLSLQEQTAICHANATQLYAFSFHAPHPTSA